MKKTEINIFILVALLCGWFGIFVDTILTKQPEGGSLGMLIWLVVPFLIALVLRTCKKDWIDNGFAFHFKGNIKWYVAAIIINIAVGGVCVALGTITNTITYRLPKTDNLLAIILTGILMQLAKNIFEEFAWRGYLTQKLEQTKLHDFLIYFIVGMVWFLWHVPYYFVFLDKSLLGGTSRIGLIGSSFYILLLWSIMYVELYRITHSVWPCVIMHATSNVIQSIFVNTEGGITFSSKGAELILNPVSGLLAMAIFVAFGIGMREYRIRRIQ